MKQRKRNEGFLWQPVAVVEKYDSTGKLIEVVKAKGNGLTNNGLARLTGLIVAEGGVEGLDDDHCRLGVGDSASAFSPSDTSLGSNQFYQTLSANHPVVEGSQISWRTEFGNDEANFTWECWGLDVDDSGSVSASSTPAELFNRKVFNFGTKSSGTWALTVSVNIAQV